MLGTGRSVTYLIHRHRHRQVLFNIQVQLHEEKNKQMIQDVACCTCPYIFSCDVPSSSTNGIVRLSIRLSVTPFWLCSHHCIIMKFSGLITNDQSKVHAKGQGQRSKVKVTEVTTQLNRFRTVTPVWIDKWFWNDAYSLMLLRRSSVKFQGQMALKSVEFDPDLAFPDCNSSLNSPMAMKWYTKLEVA